MFYNCKKCLFYNKERDDLYRAYDDEEPLDGSEPDNHFCIHYKNGIAKEIWHNKEKCPHYVEK